MLLASQRSMALYTHWSTVHLIFCVIRITSRGIVCAESAALIFRKEEDFSMRKFLKKTSLLLLLLPAMLLLPACRETAPADQPGEEALPALFSGDELLLQDETGQEYSSIHVHLPENFYAQLAAAQPEYSPEQDPASLVLCREISRALEALSGEYLAACRAEDEAQRQADPGYSASHQMELQLFYAGPDFISLRAERYDDISGAAHPLLSFRGYNFDLGGNALSLSALLGASPEACFPEIAAQLEAEGELENYYPNLALLLQEGFAEDKWCANAGQLLFFYDPYEVAAYAMGPQEFSLPR